ncbi:MAG: DUF3105 domain-containing protein [Caldilineaceae bacterium SB0675_bin_29]|uniref:DUF3105 domain-containing protein n=1 Tax=Caldilineaceae bacterium SB0675_bin_29 TaxID=2605266 RepID=A0A6B1G6U8_9CHLR|nr:DUF3105 domain-containing protein [Caldilineaceae bacterium SB0675_bin_29]
MATRSRSRKKSRAKGGRHSQQDVRGRLARPSRQEVKEIAAKRRLRQNLYIYGGGAILIAIVALVIYVNIRNTAPVGEEESFASQGNTHIQQGSASPIDYNSTPPTSGPHYPGLAPWDIYDEPIRYEQVVHNMEDGGVIVYYQCEDSCPELREQLAGVVQPYLDSGRHVLMMPNDPNWTGFGSQSAHRDMEARIALTAWQRLDKFDEFDAGRIRAFIDRYEGIDHHVR